MAVDSKVLDKLHSSSVVQKVPLKMLQIDRSYQRNPSQSLVELIANDYDELASELVLVSNRGKRSGDILGGYFLVNGQHRSLAAQKLDHEDIWARIMDTSKLDDPAALEAALRIKLNVKLGDQPLERFKAQVRAGDEDSLAIVKILAHFGTRVNEKIDMNEGINSIATMEALYAVDGGALLAETLEIIKEAFGNLSGKRVSAAMLKGLGWFVEKHGSQTDRGRLMDRIRLAGTEQIHRRGITQQSVMGGSLWMNYYRAFVELYNDGLQQKSRLEWILKGANKFSVRSKGTIGATWEHGVGSTGLGA